MESKFGSNSMMEFVWKIPPKLGWPTIQYVVVTYLCWFQSAIKMGGFEPFLSGKSLRFAILKFAEKNNSSLKYSREQCHFMLLHQECFYQRRRRMVLQHDVHTWTILLIANYPLPSLFLHPIKNSNFEFVVLGLESLHSSFRVFCERLPFLIAQYSWLIHKWVKKSKHM